MSKATHTSNKTALRTLPKVIVWDLDGCCWLPEMYQLWGGGVTPFKTKDDGQTVHTKDGRPVELLANVRHILEHLLEHPEVENGSTKIAIASTCDEPDWARELLRTFKLTHPKTKQKVLMGDLFHAHEIYKAPTKQTHFQNIKKKFPGVEFDEMIFFDNQHNNIRDVGKLGVNAVLTPDGVFWDHWVSHCGPKPDWTSRL